MFLISSPLGGWLTKIDVLVLREYSFVNNLDRDYSYIQACVQRSPLGNGRVTVIYSVTAIYTGQLCRKHNIRQLEIFGICLVTGDTGLPLYTGPFYADYHLFAPATLLLSRQS